jgi:hypothetical protein
MLTLLLYRSDLSYVGRSTDTHTPILIMHSCTSRNWNLTRSNFASLMSNNRNRCVVGIKISLGEGLIASPVRPLPRFCHLIFQYTFQSICLIRLINFIRIVLQYNNTGGAWLYVKVMPPAMSHASRRLRANAIRHQSYFLSDGFGHWQTLLKFTRCEVVMQS